MTCSNCQCVFCAHDREALRQSLAIQQPQMARMHIDEYRGTQLTRFDVLPDSLQQALRNRPEMFGRAEPAPSGKDEYIWGTP